MTLTSSPVSAAASLPPIPGALTYYPAIHRGTFRNPRAALASIGCIGAAAELQLANAKAEGSPVVAVPAKVSNAPADLGKCLALVRRKPGGKADLFLGLLCLASEDRSEAVAIADSLLESAKVEKVFVFEWTRQPRAVQ